jgi:hypothetical protein
VLSSAGDFRLVARYTENNVEIALEELSGKEWVDAEGESMTLGKDGAKAFCAGAEETWGPLWRD